jgi:hypothetical protein
VQRYGYQPEKSEQRRQRIPYIECLRRDAGSYYNRDKRRDHKERHLKYPRPSHAYHEDGKPDQEQGNHSGLNPMVYHSGTPPEVLDLSH